MTRKWTPEEDARLRELARGHTAKDIAALMPGRSDHAVWNRASELGVKLPHQNWKNSPSRGTVITTIYKRQK